VCVNYPDGGSRVRSTEQCSVSVFDEDQTVTARRDRRKTSGVSAVLEHIKAQQAPTRRIRQRGHVAAAGDRRTTSRRRVCRRRAGTQRHSAGRATPEAGGLIATAASLVFLTQRRCHSPSGRHLDGPGLEG